MDALHLAKVTGFCWALVHAVCVWEWGRAGEAWCLSGGGAFCDGQDRLRDSQRWPLCSDMESGEDRSRDWGSHMLHIAQVPCGPHRCTESCLAVSVHQTASRPSAGLSAALLTSEHPGRSISPKPSKQQAQAGHSLQRVGLGNRSALELSPEPWI